MEESNIELAPEEKARLARLYEEVRGRVEEMSLIISRLTASNQGDQQRPKMTAHTVVLTNQIKSLKSESLAHMAASARYAGDDDEILCVEDINGCGCYNYTKGICSPC